MKFCVNIFVSFCSVLAAACCLAQEPVTNLAQSWIPDDTNSTVIISQRLTYDPDKQIAVFEEDVFVDDPEIDIYADLLTVSFNEENEVTKIVADGSVRILQKDKVATARKAVYDVVEDKVTLTGSPRVTSGEDEMRGEVITFWPKTSKIRCEPQAWLCIHPSEDSDRSLSFYPRNPSREEPEDETEEEEERDDDE